MRKRLTALFSSSFIILLTVVIVTAQANCTALFEEALLAVEDNCDTTGRNEACYGYNQVAASFINDVDDDFFTQPADITAIDEIETISTTALNRDTGEWGVALMNVQANLPNTLPGQNVTFFLLGDTEVENAVSTEDVFEGSEGIEVTVVSAAGANIRSGPGLNFNVITGAADGNTLIADGISEDGEWLRVVTRNRPLWVNLSVIDDSAEGIADLPTLTPDLTSPMQAFYLRTGIGQPECEDFPDNTLLVQGPENIEVNITVNGADITIGSTVGLRIIEIDGEFFLEAIAFAGEIDFMGQTLLPGERSIACLGDADDRGLDGEDNDLTVTCDASEPEPVDEFNEDWCSLDQLPASLLNYEISIGCSSFVPVTTNTGSNPDLGDGSFVDELNCSTLSLVSPLVPVSSGAQNFTWNTALGNNVSYQLVFYNFEGAEVESFFTLPISTPDASETTSYNVNLGAETSTGGEFSWEVRAYVNGVYACASGRSATLVRTGEQNPAPPDTSAFFASLSNCYTFYGNIIDATVSWTGAPDSSVFISYEDDTSPPPITFTINESTGAVDITGDFFINNVTITSGGTSIALGSC